MATDHYETLNGADGPAKRAFAITPHDTNELKALTTGIYVGTTGHVAIQTQRNDDVVIFKNVQAGTTLPIRARRVLATGTTAVDIVGLS